MPPHAILPAKYILPSHPIFLYSHSTRPSPKSFWVTFSPLNHLCIFTKYIHIYINFTERQVLWSLSSVDFHTFTLQLSIQTQILWRLNSRFLWVHFTFRQNEHIPVYRFILPHIKYCTKRWKGCLLLCLLLSYIGIFKTLVRTRKHSSRIPTAHFCISGWCL